MGPGMKKPAAAEAAALTRPVGRTWLSTARTLASAAPSGMAIS